MGSCLLEHRGQHRGARHPSQAGSVYLRRAGPTLSKGCCPLSGQAKELERELHLSFLSPAMFSGVSETSQTSSAHFKQELGLHVRVCTRVLLFQKKALCSLRMSHQ